MPKMYSVENIQKTGTYEDVDRALLADIPLPSAGDRTRWFGIQHEELVKTLQDEIVKAGMTVEDETWTLSGKGERLFGYIDVALDEDAFEDTKKALDLPDEIEYDGFALDDIELRMGLRHSNDSTVALYLMVVPRMKAWGNGITVDGGNISLHRRHTQAIGDTEDGLEKACKEGVKTFLLKAATIQGEIDMLRSIRLTDESAHHVMVMAAAKKVLTWSMIAKVQKIWSEERGQNAWDLYMAMTRPGMSHHIYREMGLINQSRKIILELCEENVAVIAAEMDTEAANQAAPFQTFVDLDPDGTVDQLLRDGHFSPTGMKDENDRTPVDAQEEPVETEQVPEVEEPEVNALPAEEQQEWDLADVF